MDAEMRKRLEEAIKETLNCDNCVCKEVGECMGTSMCPLYRHALKCAELGYKEAIALAKEWLAVKGVFSGKTCGDLKQYIIDFEADMNKFWEEKK